MKSRKPLHLLYYTQVSLLCDADKRATHSGTGYVATIASVNAYHESYRRRMTKAARFGRKAAQR
jgi:hypothetical protein